MVYPADFHDAHLRHWQDAELLFEHQRWANADQLYGLSAECGLKAVMVDLGMPVGRHGVPTQREHRQHVDALWAEFISFASGRGGVPYVQMLPTANPFAAWSIDNRYAHGRHFSKAAVDPHRAAARTARQMAERAREEN